MSWETLATADLKFREGVPPETRREVLEAFEEALEANFEKDGLIPNLYVLTDVNWTSHVEGDKVWEVFKEHCKKLEDFSFSLYYLGEPNESIYFERGSKCLALIDEVNYGDE